MNIVKAIKSTKLMKKLPNGLFEVKEEVTDSKYKAHWFEDENGKKQGEYRSWWDNGTLKEHCFLKDGELQGEYRSWCENGTLKEHCFFKDGKLQGEYKEWYDNGTLGLHCFFKDGKIIEEYI